MVYCDTDVEYLHLAKKIKMMYVSHKESMSLLKYPLSSVKSDGICWEYVGEFADEVYFDDKYILHY